MLAAIRCYRYERVVLLMPRWRALELAWWVFKRRMQCGS